MDGFGEKRHMIMNFPVKLENQRIVDKLLSLWINSCIIDLDGLKDALLLCIICLKDLHLKFNALH